ncbi:MAG: P-loop NTPase, partial [Methanophagales archaeon]|nr:P-loop NTPase [Methanophagales archaeon]
MVEEEKKNRMEEEEAAVKASMDKVKHKIMVMSGKGGVGKTTTVTNLASIFPLFEKSVIAIDANIHGPNIAKMLGIEQANLVGSNLGIEPIEVIPNLKAV